MKRQEMLKYFSGTSGAWSVMMNGDTVMPMLFVNNWDSKGIKILYNVTLIQSSSNHNASSK